MTSFSRPGVSAAVRLAAIQDPIVWEQVAKQYRPMLLEKKGKELVAMDDWCETLGAKLQSGESQCITKNDLVSIIKWKFAKGKPRPYMKYIQANTEKAVKDCSKLAFEKAQQGDIDCALKEITKLNGLGVAGASAVLSLHRPDLCSFMDDEVIEALYEGKRGYTKAIYKVMNEKCMELSEALGEDWTPRLVGKTLWTAARVSASGGQDLTLGQEVSDPNDSEPESTMTRKAKRHRRS